MRKAILTLALLATCLVLPAPAGAAAPDFLLQAPEDGLTGGTAGRLDNPRGMAANPDNGHVYVAEFNNARISEFTAWGVFVKAWGWDVAPEGAPGDTPSDELEVCTAACKAGITGNGAGQMNGPKGIALDANGNLYVHEGSSGAPRVQKFSPAGDFLLMWGGEVNKTTGANLCTKADVEAGDECGVGVSGSADGQFSAAVNSVGPRIAYNPLTSSVFVGDVDRIQEFGTDGTFAGDVDFEGELAALDGRAVDALAADPNTGDLYFALGSSPPTVEPIYKLTAAGALLDDDFAAAGKAPYPRALATDVDGNLYVALKRYTDNNAPTVDTPGEVVAFDSDGDPIAGMELGDRFAAASENGAAASLNGLATNVSGPASEEPGDLYLTYFNSSGVSHMHAYGPAPVAFEAPPLRAPQIEDQYATAVDSRGATLQAEINPRFWQDATYYLQYGTKACPEAGWEGAACSQKPSAPGAPLTAKSVNRALRTEAVFLDGLAPETAYHYRFVAESSGGGPVAGLGGKPGEPGEEGTFRTFPLAAAGGADCPNARFRIGPSAKLPDCRAYELVSPLEKGSADATLIAEGADEVSQSALAGESFTYSSRRAFGVPESSPFISQYLANRGAAGWSSDALAPPRSRRLLHLEASLFNEFSAFSADLCSAWLGHGYEPILAAGAVEGYPNLYRRGNCDDPPSYEALSTAEPPNRSAELYYQLIAQGFSADGAHTIFNANAKLTEGAPALGETEPLLYEHVAGQAAPRFVCVLPSGNPNSTSCGAGTPAGILGGRRSSLQGAISADGSRIFWTAFGDSLGFLNGSPGRIFARVEGSETVAVSSSVSPEPAWFWGAAQDGSKAIFEVLEGPLKDNLYEFDVAKALAKEAGAATLIAKDVRGMAGISEDASRLYLVSGEDLDAGGPASAGQPNLYFHEGGAFAFVATLPGEDLVGSDNAPSPVDRVSTRRAARLSDDGRQLAFISSGSLTGYDNTDVGSGEADAEVFLYDAVQDELRCVSCNPSNARPSGEAGVAARIPAWERPLYASRALSADGQRLFFESYEPLVPRDTNGALDVYQWEAAGKGDCDQDDPTYGEASEGCVDLISSGTSAADSRFLDADASGEDVFIGTLGSLLPQDYGLIDVYDARVGGGFPQPATPAICEGEACQGPTAPPNDPTPASASVQGAGNVIVKRPCPKGKRVVRKAGKPRCLRRHKRQRKPRAAAGRGARR